jgi:hypothetical protein
MQRPGAHARIAPTSWRNGHRHWTARDNLKSDLQAKVHAGVELCFVMEGVSSAPFQDWVVVGRLTVGPHPSRGLLG